VNCDVQYLRIVREALLEGANKILCTIRVVEAHGAVHAMYAEALL